MTRDDIERMVNAGEVDQLWTLFDALKSQRDRAEHLARDWLQDLTNRISGGKAKPGRKEVTASAEAYDRATAAWERLTEALKGFVP